MNGNNDDLFPKAKKMVLFEIRLVEKDGERKKKGLISFNRKEVRKTLVNRGQCQCQDWG